MTIKLYNTQSRQKEEFEPKDQKKVSMYVCGITPYDETHLGHGRAYVTFDVVRRYLEFSGYKVKYVQNVTDVDDKIISKALSTQDSGFSPNEIKQRCAEIVDKHFSSYQEVMAELNVKPPTKYVKATEHIKEMVKTIKTLIDKGFAYVVDGDVYFEVAKYKDYGKLSRRKLDEMKAGARVKVDERKRAPQDFSLWKAAKPGEPAWASLWGEGRPGWHVECSVMSTKYLGQPFDIHGGGRDLIFPHHENEIAQAECATGKPLVKYWMHNGFVNVNKQKMSKSLGNFFTLKDIFEKFDPMIVRFFLLQTHYRSPIDFSDEQLKEAGVALSNIQRAVSDFDFMVAAKDKAMKKKVKIDIQPLEEKFKAAMDDDFNTAVAIAVIFEIVHLMNKQVKTREYDEKVRGLLVKLLGVLGLKIERAEKSTGDSAAIEKLIAARNAARKNKDFKTADKIRDDLKAKGIVLEDTPLGTKWIS